MPIAALLALATRVPVDLSREDAARAAREELAKQIYHDREPGLARRLAGWLYRHALDLLDHAAGASPGGYVGLVLLVGLLVVVVVALRLGLGPMRRTATAEQTLFTGRRRTAAEHRAAADEHAAAGRYAESVRDRLRAVVTGLEERGLLDPRPGRTADEAAAAAGAVVPDCAASLRAAARTFDDVWYGGRPATADQDAALRDLDDRVRAARPGSRVPVG